MDESRGTSGDGYFGQERAEVAQFVPASARRVLDVGCGAGGLGLLLKRRLDCHVTGIEVHAAAAAVARTNLDRVLELDLEQATALPCAPGEFDCIVCADVLEHLRWPARVLEGLRSYLAPSGVLIASIPNVRHAQVVIPLVLGGRWEYRDAGVLDRTHLRFFTPIEIGRLLREAGFSVHSAHATMTDEHPAVPALAEVVGSLGGDAERFRTESRIVQLVVIASPQQA